MFDHKNKRDKRILTHPHTMLSNSANATGYYAGHPTADPALVNEEPQRGGIRSGLKSAYPRECDHELLSFFLSRYAIVFSLLVLI